MFRQSFNTMHNFHYDEVVGIWQLEKCQYSLMFKSFLVVSCLMPSKPCVLFSLSTLYCLLVFKVVIVICEHETQFSKDYWHFVFMILIGLMVTPFQVPRYVFFSFQEQYYLIGL
jgi:hypothetical protein